MKTFLPRLLSFSGKLSLLVLFLVLFQSHLSAQISGPTTVCPNTTVRYTLNRSSCSGVNWTVQGSWTIIGQGTVQGQPYIDVQFPHPSSGDVHYTVNVGFICGSSGSASLPIVVRFITSISSSSQSIPCSFTGQKIFQYSVPVTYADIQWTTTTGWPVSSAPTVVNGPQGIKQAQIGYNVNNLNGGTVKMSVKNTACPNAAPSEHTFNITRASDLPALEFTSTSATGVCGAAAVNVAVTPPGGLSPSGYRWYSTPANVLKINGGVHNDAGTALLTSTPSVSLAANGTQSDVVATVYVNAVYPGGCSTAYTSWQLNVSPTLPATPTITSVRASEPGDPTDYLFTAPAISGATYNWYVNGTLRESSSANTLLWYFPCMVSNTVYCTITNGCGTSAPSNSISRTGGCRDRERISSFTVSPNPASDMISIAVRNDTNKKSTAGSSVDSFNEVNIYDFYGNLVKRRQYTPARQGTIDVGNLRTGTYYIEIKNGQYTEKQTLIIQK